MTFFVGTMLALLFGLAARLVGLDKDKALYPTVMIFIALFYVLFAVIDGLGQTIWIESVVACIFIGLSIAGFQSSLWLVVLGLALHGILDAAHGHLIKNLGVPMWWPNFCASYDIVAAAYLAWLLFSNRIKT